MDKSPRLSRGFTFTFGGPDLSHEWPAFDAAFGKFIRGFGRTESILAVILEQFSLQLVGRGDLSLDVLRALIGSRRTPDLATTTKLCLKAATFANCGYGDADAAEIDAAFAQLSEIRFLRDRTAHYGIGVKLHKDQTVFVVANRFTVNDIDKSERLYFRREHLESAESDLAVLRQAIECTLFKTIPTPWEGLRPPWLYKPSELIRVPFPSSPNPQQPAPPPQA